MIPYSSKSGKFLCVMVTGISGAGKSQAIKCLEDFGFFCVDNLPAPLIQTFADLMVASGQSMQKVALGIDVREGKFFKELSKSFHELKIRGINTWTIFLDANDETLLRRFSETRRKHPLSNSVLGGIHDERKRLREIRAQANKIIETNNLTLSELKEMVASSLPMTFKRTLQISLYSFGYKYGVPVDAEIIWDVRFMPNPYYLPSLRNQTGLSRQVRKFVLRQKMSSAFLHKFFSLVSQCLSHYIKEGKSHLTIAIGCTGGKHRSVTIVEELSAFLKKKGYPVSTRHRDISQS